METAAHPEPRKFGDVKAAKSASDRVGFAISVLQAT
jgi:hypothetical protein